jgi:hypothetical protein
MIKRYVIFIILSIFLLVGLCNGQYRISNQELNSNLRDVPSFLQPQHNALGDRMDDANKALTIYSGRLVDANGNEAPARVTYQLPNLVRLEGFKDRDAVLSFDGERANGISSRENDEPLIELFVMDFAEGMFSSVQESAAVRLIGTGFGPDPQSNKNTDGPRYDIYEIAAPPKGLEDKTVRIKKYYFDSGTKLLLSTRYNDHSVSPAKRIETRFSNWERIEGSAYPTKVERYENGKRIFAFIVEIIESGAPLDKELFR